MSQQGELTVVVAEAPPARTPRVLARVLRIVDAGPRVTGRAALVSLAGTCVAGLAVTRNVRPVGPLNGAQQQLMLIGKSGLALAGVLALLAFVVPARRRAFLDRLVAPQQRAAIWLALAAWFPLLLVVAYYRVESTLPPTQVWISFGYLDKRWITATYLVGALAPMVLVVVAARLLETGRAHPASWRAWLRDLTQRRQADPVVLPAGAGVAEGDSALKPDQAVEASPARGSGLGARAIRLGRVPATVLTALGLAYYFYGPPWYLNRTFGSVAIGNQEDVFLGGFQAIAKGAVPYIGPAAIQYGPGAQLLSYWYMRHVATFSVLGFRESWAMFQWVGASIFFVVLFLALGYFRGLVAALMSALIYPALQLMGFTRSGAYAGYWGWANPLRYAGAISLILLLPAVIRRAPAWRGVAGAAVLGLLWGALSYVAQENLAAGAVGAVVVAALLLFSGSASWRAVIATLLAVLAGFIVSWLPVVAFYATKGLLSRFLYLYFFIPKAVAEGYSNTPYGGFHPVPAAVAHSASWANIYYAVPFLVAVLALLAVVEFRPFRIALEWSRERIMLVAVLLTTILLYQGALLRADADHLTGTLLVLPVLVVAGATALPRLMGGRRLVTLVLAGAAIVAGSLLLLPLHTYKPASIGAEAAAPWLDRQRLAGMPAPAPPATLAAQRIGAGVWAGPACCQHYSEPMSDFIQFGDELRATIGNRTTYVAGFPAGYPGIIYFIAGLRPAPFPLDEHTMVLTAAQADAYETTFVTNVLPHTQALVTQFPKIPEVAAFLKRYPQAVKIRLLYHQTRHYWVLLSSI